jgi:CheY-like chemotaxis protein
MSDSPRATILVAEDDEAIRLLLVAVLSREGFTVDAVTNGAQAIERLAAGRYDVVLLDLMMPTLGGLAVIEHLEQTAEAPSPAIIVLTAVAPTQLPILDGKPIRHLLRKPFDMAELTAAVRESIECE